MSGVKRDAPKDIETLQSLIKSMRQNRQPVVFTDSQCKANDFHCRTQPNVNVLDLTEVVKKVEAKLPSTREATGRPASRQSRVYPCGPYEHAPEPEEYEEESSCSCFGGKKSPTARQQKLLEKLQQRVGSAVEIKLHHFENWGKTQSAIVLAAHPETKDHVTKLIRAAKENKVRVRSAGSRHSWARIVADDSFLVLYLDKLQSDYKGGAKVRHAEKPHMVDVMAGITTGDLKRFQVENGVHLPCNVILDSVTVSGVIASGCHGVGWDVKTPGDYVTRMRIFDSDGNLRVYTNEDREMMLAVSANFGAFGIIYDMTIQLIPNRIVRMQNKYLPAKSLFNDPAAFKELVETNWSVELFWFPYNTHSIFSKYDPMEDELFLRVINEDTTDEPEVGESFYEEQARLDYITHEGLLASSFLLRNFPSLTPVLCDASFSVLQMLYPEEDSPKQALPHAVHYRKYIHFTPVRDMEFAFDLQNDYPKMIKVIKAAMDSTMKFNKQGKYPLNIAMEMRWMAYGESFLTPAIIGNPAYGGSGHVYYIEILSVSGSEYFEEYCIDVAQKWIALGGIPHLAKDWEFIPGIFGHYKKRTGKSIDQFKKQLRKSNADPSGMFLNSTICKLLNM